MGDNIGDASMVDGMMNTCAVLKIGFLYDNVSIIYCITNYNKQLLYILQYIRTFAKDYELNKNFDFLQVESSLASFMEKFDIVLVDDQTMQVPIDILQLLL